MANLFTLNKHDSSLREILQEKFWGSYPGILYLENLGGFQFKKKTVSHPTSYLTNDVLAAAH